MQAAGDGDHFYDSDRIVWGAGTGREAQPVGRTNKESDYYLKLSYNKFPEVGFLPILCQNNTYLVGIYIHKGVGI